MINFNNYLLEPFALNAQIFAPNAQVFTQKRQIFASNAQVSRLGTGKMGKNS
jgi:hypothetical protein